MFDYFRLIIFMRRVINLAESEKQTNEEHDFDKNIAAMFNLLLESQYITYDLIYHFTCFVPQDMLGP